MDLTVLDDHVNLGVPLGRVMAIQEPEQVPEQRVVFARSYAVMQHPRGRIEGPGHVVFLVLAWCNE
jgi:hypothetical protein